MKKTYRITFFILVAISLCGAVFADMARERVELRKKNLKEHSYATAIEEQKKALGTANPSEKAEIYDHIGYLYSMMGNDLEAIAYFYKAIDAEPENPASYANMAGVSFMMNEFDAARDYYTKAKELYLKRSDLKKAELMDRYLSETPQIEKFSFAEAVDIDMNGFNEPSGIVFHPARKTLFVVGDEGDICEIKKDGTLIRTARVKKADFEGITCDPATGLLYVAIEGKDIIAEVDPVTLEILREFSISRKFEGKTVIKPGGDGIEGITFIPDAKHPEGGLFYAVNQVFDIHRDDDISGIFELSVPLRGKAVLYAKILAYYPIRFESLSGICYDSNTDSFFVLSTVRRVIMQAARDGKLIKVYTDLPVFVPEGITIDDEGHLYITQDIGGIFKIKLKDRLGTSSSENKNER